MKNKFLTYALLAAISQATLSVTYASDDIDNSHGDSGTGDHIDSDAVVLTTDQIKTARIKIEPVYAKYIRSVIKAPGEVKFNTYKTASISPRITAQVIGCHVELGEDVRMGQAIVTLSSIEMAEAQGALLVADREWKRVTKLGRKVVSDSRYTEAKVNWELAKGKVKAYGMDESQIKNLLHSKDFSLANGRFELVAKHGGIVLNENYVLGQQVEPGHELIRITNHRSLWIEANVPPSELKKVQIGNNVKVSFDGQTLPAKVIQQYHSLDETTRTAKVRIAIDNTQKLLNPGMFVETEIETSFQSSELTLPEAAVLRREDGWLVMTQTDMGEFISQEVELEKVTNGQAIVRGIKPGTSVVTEGSFFVWSETAKAEFGDDD